MTMDESLDRRRFLRDAGVGAAIGAAAALTACGRAPTAEELAKLTGTSKVSAAEPMGAPQGPGQHTLPPLPYAKDALVINDPANPKIKGISAQVVTWHHDTHQAGYVKALNEIETDLAAIPKITAAPNYSQAGELKRRETFNASGMILHELYWLNLCAGGAPRADTMSVSAKLAADFGSLARWQEDFVATANTPNAGWAILALAPYDGKLHNYACQFHDMGGVWGTVPIVALDVWEHAYYFDYGPDRGSYVSSVLRLLNWPWIEERYAKAARSLA